MFQKVSGMEKRFMYRKWREAQISIVSFSPHGAKKLRGGTLQCFRKIRLAKCFLHKKGILLLSVETFLCHSTENLEGEPFCVSGTF